MQRDLSQVLMAESGPFLSYWLTCCDPGLECMRVFVPWTHLTVLARSVGCQDLSVWRAKLLFSLGYSCPALLLPVTALPSAPCSSSLAGAHILPLRAALICPHRRHSLDFLPGADADAKTGSHQFAALLAAAAACGLSTEEISSLLEIIVCHVISRSNDL